MWRRRCPQAVPSPHPVGRGALARGWGGALCLVMGALLPGTAPAAPSSVAAARATPEGLPAPGRYEATLCTAASALADPGCSEVQLQVRPRGRWRLQIHDLVYHLRLRGPELDLALMHGSMQIDEMAVAYRWVDGRLQFVDPLKNTRYEIRPGRRL